MRLLLDTHIWLWSLLAPEQLSRTVAGALQHDGNELWLSPISVWELSVLVQRGRLSLHGGFHEWVAEALDRVPLNEAPLTHEVARETHELSSPHQDPADRLLAATARVYELTLVTGDERLLDTTSIPTLANR